MWGFTVKMLWCFRSGYLNFKVTLEHSWGCSEDEFKSDRNRTCPFSCSFFLDVCVSVHTNPIYTVGHIKEPYRCMYVMVRMWWNQWLIKTEPQFSLSLYFWVFLVFIPNSSQVQAAFLKQISLQKKHSEEQDTQIWDKEIHDPGDGISLARGDRKACCASLFFFFFSVSLC